MRLNPRYNVGGLELDNYKTTLPTRKVLHDASPPPTHNYPQLARVPGLALVMTCL